MISKPLLVQTSLNLCELGAWGGACIYRGINDWTNDWYSVNMEPNEPQMMSCGPIFGFVRKL